MNFFLRRIIAGLAVFAAASLFAACSAAGGAGGLRLRTVTKVPGGAADASLKREIILAVDSSLGDEFFLAADNFCKTAGSLSKGEMTVTVEKSSSPLSDARHGRADIALAGGRKAGEFHTFFNITSERFRYASYEDFSMLCNSDDVLSALSEACGLRVLAAYYTGSNALVSYAPPDKIIAGGRASNQEDEPASAVVYSIPGSGTADMLSPFCQSAVETVSLSERILSLSSPDAIAEFTTDELTRAGFVYASASEVVAEAAGITGGEIPQEDEYPESLVFTRTYHSITPAWLAISTQLHENLTPQLLAVIDESAAAMCKDIDKLYLDREQAVFDMLLQENAGSSQDSFTLSRSRIRRAASEKRGDISVEQKRLIDALERLK